MKQILIFITLCLSLYFLRNQNTGDTTIDAINKLGNKLESKFDELINEIRKDRQERKKDE